ncbi:MAG: hypothetical protein KTR24_05430 [Saprospiraceae bacterium]|nr:hypothetical protein [Saprospiraceae bacterium]
MHRVYLCLILFCVSACAQSHNQAGWKKVFQNDETGKAVYGDKLELIAAVRMGYPVRIGWGSNRIEHVAEAEFLSIFEGEVFGQIETIIGQAPRIDQDSVKIRFRQENHWTKIAGTNGYTTAIMSHYLQDSIVGGGVDRYAATTWYVCYPQDHSEISPRPLWREGSPNWEEWMQEN